MEMIKLVAIRLGMDVEHITSDCAIIDGWMKIEEQVEVDYRCNKYTITDGKNDVVLEYRVDQKVAVNFLFDMAM